MRIPSFWSEKEVSTLKLKTQHKTLEGAGRLPQKNWVGMCGLLPKIITLLKIKICEFSTALFMTWPKIRHPFMTVAAGTTALNVIYERFFWWWSYRNSNQEVAASKINIPRSRLECKNHILFMTKMTKIDTLFLTKTSEKPFDHFGPHIPL